MAYTNLTDAQKVLGLNSVEKSQQTFLGETYVIDRFKTFSLISSC